MAYVILLQLCGGVTLFLGVWIKFDKETFLAIHIVHGLPIEPMFDTIPYILMGIGGSMIVICFTGACGACAESVCFLYFVSMFYIKYGEINKTHC